MRIEISNNELQLVQESAGKYVIMWGEKGNTLSRTPLKTPTGRWKSESAAIKTFFKAIDTARHFTFKKVTIEEILEKSEEISR